MHLSLYVSPGGKVAHDALLLDYSEGCNTAMESAMKLVNIIKAEMEQNEEEVCSIKTMSNAFTLYGRSRPSDTRQLQEVSAARNMGSK